VFSTIDLESGERAVVVRSAGPDGEFETEDDITAEGVLPPLSED
jgi:hypothetical protein